MNSFSIGPILVLLVILMTAGSGTAHAIIDPVASYSGPFDGASNFNEIVQEFEISESGLLNALAAHVPTLPSQIHSYEFSWELLNATEFDEKLMNIDELPVLFQGSAWSDTTTLDDPWDSAPIQLATDLELPVVAGQRFMLRIRIESTEQWTAMWVGGSGSLPGGAYMRKILRGLGPWQNLAGFEFGRLIELDAAVRTTEQTWSSVKCLYR